MLTLFVTFKLFKATLCFNKRDLALHYEAYRTRPSRPHDHSRPGLAWGGGTTCQQLMAWGIGQQVMGRGEKYMSTLHDPSSPPQAMDRPNHMMPLPHSNHEPPDPTPSDHGPLTPSSCGQTERKSENITFPGTTYATGNGK